MFTGEYILDHANHTLSRNREILTLKCTFAIVWSANSRASFLSLSGDSLASAIFSLEVIALSSEIEKIAIEGPFYLIEYV